MSRFNLELHSDYFLAAKRTKNIVAIQFLAVTSYSHIIFFVMILYYMV